MEQQPPQMPPMNQAHMQPLNPPLMSPRAPPNQFADVHRRIRMLEESTGNLRRKVTLNEQNTIDSLKQHSLDIRTMYAELDDLKHSIKEIKDDLLKIIMELQQSAKKDDVTALEKYVNLWTPAQYVTHDEVMRILYPEQKYDKKQVATFIETHADVHDLIRDDPDTFIEKMNENPELLRLFREVNIHDLSEKLKNR